MDRTKVGFNLSGVYKGLLDQDFVKQWCGSQREDGNGGWIDHSSIERSALAVRFRQEAVDIGIARPQEGIHAMNFLYLIGG